MGLLAQLKLLSNRQISASGISMLNNLGGLGSFGLNSSSGNNHAIGSAGHTGSLFGLDESGNGGTIMNGQVNNGSMKSSNGSNNASAGSANGQQQQQQRVLVAN